MERWNQHLYDRGGMRRVHLRGRENILKRLVVHSGAANLGLLMRKLFGKGTPRGLQGRFRTLFPPLGTLGSGGSAVKRIFGIFHRLRSSAAPLQIVSAAARKPPVSPRAARQYRPHSERDQVCPLRGRSPSRGRGRWPEHRKAMSWPVSLTSMQRQRPCARVPQPRCDLARTGP